MSPHLAAFLSCLIIGLGLCHGDTRNIPTNMFVPIDQDSNNFNGNWNTSLPGRNSEFSLSVKSTGEAHAVTDPSIEQRKRLPQENSQEGLYDDRLSYNPNIPNYNNPNYYNNGPRFSGPVGVPNVFNSNNFESSFRSGSNNRASSFEDRLNEARRRAMSSRSSPLLSTGGFTVPYESTGLSNGFSNGFQNGFGPDSSSGNFYRQESYSYSSDGNGPPQIERNVFDSRLPNGGSSWRTFSRK